VESPFIEFGQISTVVYFAYFLIIVPLISLVENTLTELSMESDDIRSQLPHSLTIIHSSPLPTLSGIIRPKVTASGPGLFTNTGSSHETIANTCPRVLKPLIKITDPDGSRTFIDSFTGATLKLNPNGQRQNFVFLTENRGVDALEIASRNKDSIVQKALGVLGDENSLVDISNVRIGIKSILNQAIDSNNVHTDAPRP
jgi:hypothetical protein